MSKLFIKFITRKASTRQKGRTISQGLWPLEWGAWLAPRRWDLFPARAHHPRDRSAFASTPSWRVLPSRSLLFRPSGARWPSIEIRPRIHFHPVQCPVEKLKITPICPLRFRNPKAWDWESEPAKWETVKDERPCKWVQTLALASQDVSFLLSEFEVSWLAKETRKTLDPTKLHPK